MTVQRVFVFSLDRNVFVFLFCSNVCIDIKLHYLSPNFWHANSTFYNFMLEDT